MQPDVWSPMIGDIARIGIVGIGGLGIAAGALVAAQNLIRLTAGRPEAGTTEAVARSKAWSGLRFSLIGIAVGLSLLGAGTRNDAVQWVADVAIFATAGGTLILWLRSQRRGQPPAGTTEPAPRSDAT